MRWKCVPLLAAALFCAWAWAAPPEARAGEAVPLIEIGPRGVGTFYLSNPSCYQPDPAQNACYINWRVIQAVADATSTYMTSVRVLIDGKIRGNYQGFFDSAITVLPEMQGFGFRVTCGRPGDAAGGDRNFGGVHGMVVEAYAGGALGGWGSTVLTCPAFRARPAPEVGLLLLQ